MDKTKFIGNAGGGDVIIRNGGEKIRKDCAAVLLKKYHVFIFY